MSPRLPPGLGSSTTLPPQQQSQKPTSTDNGGYAVPFDVWDTEDDFSKFLPAQDLSWLETTLFDWDDGSWVISSLDTETTGYE